MIKPKTISKHRQFPRKLWELQGFSLAIYGLEEVLFFSVSAPEFVDLACRVNNFLLTSIKRMAFGTHINTHRVAAVSGFCFEGIPTATVYGNSFIFWMNLGFHLREPEKLRANYNLFLPHMASTNFWLYIGLIFNVFI